MIMLFQHPEKYYIFFCNRVVGSTYLVSIVCSNPSRSVVETRSQNLLVAIEVLSVSLLTELLNKRVFLYCKAFPIIRFI